MIKKFRLPRKIKKKLKNGFWLYYPDKDGNSLMASPSKNQEDYTAMKNGLVRDEFGKKNSRKRQKEFSEKIDKEVYVSDEILKKYVHTIFRKDLRESSFSILIRAKNNPKAVKAYFQFVNAYKLHLIDDSYGNICCMTIDSARKLLKSTYKKRK